MEVERIFCKYCKQESKTEVCLFCEENFVFDSDIVDIFGYLICEGLELKDLSSLCICCEFNKSEDQAKHILETIKDQRYDELFQKMQEIHKNPEQYLGKAEQEIMKYL